MIFVYIKVIFSGFVLCSYKARRGIVLTFMMFEFKARFGFEGGFKNCMILFRCYLLLFLDNLSLLFSNKK